MSIRPVTYYQAVCDRWDCGRVDDEGEFSAWSDHGSAIESATDSGWLGIDVVVDAASGWDYVQRREGSEPVYTRCFLLCRDHADVGVHWCPGCGGDLSETGWTLVEGRLSQACVDCGCVARIRLASTRAAGSRMTPTRRGCEDAQPPGPVAALLEELADDLEEMRTSTSDAGRAMVERVRTITTTALRGDTTPALAATNGPEATDGGAGGRIAAEIGAAADALLSAPDFARCWERNTGVVNGLRRAARIAMAYTGAQSVGEQAEDPAP